MQQDGYEAGEDPEGDGCGVLATCELLDPLVRLLQRADIVSSIKRLAAVHTLSIVQPETLSPGQDTEGRYRRQR
jgi:hypothetical protein